MYIVLQRTIKRTHFGDKKEGRTTKKSAFRKGNKTKYSDQIIKINEIQNLFTITYHYK